MVISTPGVGGGVVLRISSYRDYQRIFAGELKFSISGSLGGSDSFASILFFFFNRDFNVCIKPPRNVYGLEISAWDLLEIKFWPGHFLGF